MRFSAIASTLAILALAGCDEASRTDSTVAPAPAATPTPVATAPQAAPAPTPAPVVAAAPVVAPAPVAAPAPAAAPVDVATPAPAPAAVVVVGAPPAATAGQLIPGLLGEVFALEKESADFPTLAADAKPVAASAFATIDMASNTENFPGTQLKTNFYVRWTGVLRVAKAGLYTFTTESDDGSRLLINGKEVVANGGYHGMKEASGAADLVVGDYPIQLDFTQAGGEIGMRFSWQADGVAKQIVPATTLFHATAP